MSKKIVIVGGSVAGGVSAATRIRRIDEFAEIVLFEKNKDAAFANSGLPHYIGDAIKSRSELFVISEISLKNKYNIELKTLHEVKKINRQEKTVEVYDIRNDNTIIVKYDILLLATGSELLIQNDEWINKENVFKLNSFDDAEMIKLYISEFKPKHVTIVGGGFIGLELLRSFKSIGINVTVVEEFSQVLPPIDLDMAEIVHDYLISNGIELILNTTISEIKHFSKKIQLILKDDKIINTELVIVSTGFKPNSKLARNCDIDVNDIGAILVDKYFRTSDPNIYAIGNVIEVGRFEDDEKICSNLASPTNKQARVAGVNILGGDVTPYEGSQNTHIVKCLDLVIASTGVNEKDLSRRGQQYNIDYCVAFGHFTSKARFLTGFTPFTMKIIYDKKGTILGAQVVGSKSVDKKIDILSTAMKFRSSIYDLKKIDLAYSPQFSTDRDPINVIADIAINQYEGKVSVIRPIEFKEHSNSSTVIIDVRERSLYSQNNIYGSINIPISDLRKKLGDLDRDKLYILYCNFGNESYVASRILSQHGFKCKIIMGGFKSYIYHNKLQIRKVNKDEETSMENSREYSSDEQEIIISDMNMLESRRVSVLKLHNLAFPEPIIRTSNYFKEMESGEILKIISTDPTFTYDIESWCKSTRNIMLRNIREDGEFIAYVQKNTYKHIDSVNAIKGYELEDNYNLNRLVDNFSLPTDKSFVIFNDELDKAISVILMANTAASMGYKVNLYFTFWGLNIIRRHNSINVERNFLEKLFMMMMARGSYELPLSKWNIFGVGSLLLRKTMKEKNMASLEEMLASAQKLGVRFVACSTSMEITGIKQEELIEGVEIGGVATMFNDFDNSNLQMFI